MCLPVKPYKIEQEWTHVGLSCAVVQAREGQHRCGYVRVPPTHPDFGKGYDDVNVDVHGGLTFAEVEPCSDHTDGQGWWFGFDCAHAGDGMVDPNYKSSNPEFISIKSLYASSPWRTNEHYWTKEEVAAQCNQLAEQLAAGVTKENNG